MQYDQSIWRALLNTIFRVHRTTIISSKRYPHCVDSHHLIPPRSAVALKCSFDRAIQPLEDSYTLALWPPGCLHLFSRDPDHLKSPQTEEFISGLCKNHHLFAESIWRQNCTFTYPPSLLRPCVHAFRLLERLRSCLSEQKMHERSMPSFDWKPHGGR